MAPTHIDTQAYFSGISVPLRENREFERDFIRFAQITEDDQFTALEARLGSGSLVLASKQPCEADFSFDPSVAETVVQLTRNVVIQAYELARDAARKTNAVDEHHFPENGAVRVHIYNDLSCTATSMQPLPGLPGLFPSLCWWREGGKMPVGVSLEPTQEDKYRDESLCLAYMLSNLENLLTGDFLTAKMDAALSTPCPRLYVTKIAPVETYAAEFVDAARKEQSYFTTFMQRTFGGAEKHLAPEVIQRNIENYKEELRKRVPALLKTQL